MIIKSSLSVLTGALWDLWYAYVWLWVNHPKVLERRFIHCWFWCADCGGRMSWDPRKGAGVGGTMWSDPNFHGIRWACRSCSCSWRRADA